MQAVQVSTSTTAWPPRAARRRAWSTTRSTAWDCESVEAANVTAAAGSTGPSRHTLTSSGRTPASTTDSDRPSTSDSAPATRRSASVLPARAGPVIVTREPRPKGVSHSIALTVGSSPPSAKRSLG